MKDNRPRPAYHRVHVFRYSNGVTRVHFGPDAKGNDRTYNNASQASLIRLADVVSRLTANKLGHLAVYGDGWSWYNYNAL